MKFKSLVLSLLFILRLSRCFSFNILNSFTVCFGSVREVGIHAGGAQEARGVVLGPPGAEREARGGVQHQPAGRHHHGLPQRVLRAPPFAGISASISAPSFAGSTRTPICRYIRIYIRTPICRFYAHPHLQVYPHLYPHPHLQVLRAPPFAGTWVGSCLKTGQHSIFVITRKIKRVIYTYVGYLIY